MWLYKEPKILFLRELTICKKQDRYYFFLIAQTYVKTLLIRNFCGSWMIEKLQDCKQLTSLSRVPGEATKGRNSLNYEITHRGQHSKGGASGCWVPLMTSTLQGRGQDPGAGEAVHTAGTCRMPDIPKRQVVSSSSDFLVPSTGKLNIVPAGKRKIQDPEQAIYNGFEAERS